MKRLTLAALVGMVVVCSRAQSPSDTISGKTHQLQQVDVDADVVRRGVSATAPTHVLGRAQFLTQGVTDFADALHRLPGITLRDYGGMGGMKTVSVRGLGAQHTGVSYDGVLLSECQSGEIDVARYSLENVARLTLTVGDNDDIFIPARHATTPALLSIQSVGLPTDDCRPHVTAQMRVGSFGYASPFLRYEQSITPHVALSAVGEYTYAENDYPFTLTNINLVTRERRTNSRMSAGHGEVNMLWTPSQQHRIGAKVYYYDNSRQLPGQVRYYTNVSHERLHDRNAFGQLHYTAVLSPVFSLKWMAKYNRAESIYKNGPVYGLVNDADYTQHEAYTSAVVLYRPSERWALSYAADYVYNDLRSDLPTDTRPDRQTILQSLTAKFSSPHLTMMGRLLYSDYQNHEAEGNGARDFDRLSPSLSLAYRLFPSSTHDLYVRVSYKSIFRAPTFNESYFFHFGSTSLRPELTHQYNAGLTWRHAYGRQSSVQMTADGYLNRIIDKILAVPYNMFIWTNVNLGKVQVVGIDATLNARHHFTRRHALTFAANYSLQQAENRTRKSSPYYRNQLPYVPLHSGSMAVGYENPCLNVVLHATGVSRRYVNKEHLPDTDIDGYTDWGVTAYRTFRWRQHSLEARFDVKNLFDSQYEIVRLYPMPGRSWQCSLKYAF